MPVSFSLRHPKPAAPATIRRWRRRAAWLARALAVAERDVSIVFTNDAEIAALNQNYRLREGATNVLSFAALDGEVFPGQPPGDLGEIIISVDTAAREARQLGQSLDARVFWLLAHGFLHLLGWDHENSQAEAEAMRAKELELIEQFSKNGRYFMPKLAINVDHIATIRQARGGHEPDPVTAAAICELAGAKGIVIHLREDRRHIQERDLRLLRQTVKTKLNLEMGAAKEIIAIALEVGPDMVTLVPEKRRELTTEGGLDVVAGKMKLAAVVARLQDEGIPVSLFIDPEEAQIEAAREIGATFVELHTGKYADNKGEERLHHLAQIEAAAALASRLGLIVNAGHGLDYGNTAPVAAIAEIDELSIGHAIISRAAFVGLDKAVREMLAIVETAG
ncbi:MAG: pyridoxine 5'-phosphate synthase [Desulfobulbaceae bacterium]|jgi:pyridoxine 5-phosphate synthase|nr:pyridoxine 5'-phosphate synthase [Desulfobulbaceae bacterium]